MCVQMVCCGYCPKPTILKPFDAYARVEQIKKHAKKIRYRFLTAGERNH